MEDLKVDMENFREEVAKLLKVTTDHVEKSIKTFHDSVQGLTSLLYKHIFQYDESEIETGKFQVDTQTELAEINRNIEVLRSHHAETCDKLSNEQQLTNELMAKVGKITCQFGETCDEFSNDQQLTKELMAKVKEISCQFAETCDKLSNEQQLTKKLMAKVEKISSQFGSLDEKVDLLKSDILKMKTSHSPPPPPPFVRCDRRSSPPNQVGPIPEWMLRQRKKNNIIIFGLVEITDGSICLKEQLDSLWQDVGITDLTDDEWSAFRIGKLEDGRKRPVIVRFEQIKRKSDILLKAKNLKGKNKWLGVGITHDLTKLQCLEEKQHELHLRLDAERRNIIHSESEYGQCWRVVGRRGARRVMLVHEDATPTLSSCAQ